jgi:hypothetical protein
MRHEFPCVDGQLKGDRPQFIHPDLLIHPRRVHVRSVGPGHRTEMQAALIETGLVFERLRVIGVRATFFFSSQPVARPLSGHCLLACSMRRIRTVSPVTSYTRM